MFHNHSLGPCEVHTNIGPNRFKCFKAKYIYIFLYIYVYIHYFLLKFLRQATATIRANNSAGELCGGVPEDSMHLLRSATPGV